MTENIMLKQPDPAAKPAAKRPNETGAMSVEGFIKTWMPWLLTGVGATHP